MLIFFILFIRRDVRLSWPRVAGWLHTEINVRHRELNPDTVTNLSTNLSDLDSSDLARPLCVCVCVREVREQRHRTANRDDYILSKLFTDATTDRPLSTI